MAEDEMYLENLREFIIEEDKIVTYKWLSRTLSVNVNQAKQMLYAFAHNQKEEKKYNLNIVYVVGGSIKDDDGKLIHKYLFSNEKDLEDIKKCFDSLTSLHIYSVQKNKLKDSNVLYTTDYDLQKQNIMCSNRWSNITCKLATKRILEVHEDNNYVENNQKQEPKSNESSKPLIPPASTVPRLAKPVASISKKNTKSKGKPIKKGDVASFFARQISSNTKGEKPKDEPKKEEKPSLEKDKTNTNSADKERNEQNKPDNLSSENTKKEQKIEEKSHEIPEQNKKDNDDNDLKDNDKKKMKTGNKTDKKSSPEEKKKKQTKKSQDTVVEKPKRGVTRNKINNSAKDENYENENKRKKKKRRRVKDFSDSSSEEEVQIEAHNEMQNGGGEDSTPIPDQQSEEHPIPDQQTGETAIPDQQPEEAMDTNDTVEKPQRGRRRKRVLKSKTYLNDEGYMVTEKVYESESEECSNDDDEISTKPEVTEITLKEAPKKTVVKQKMTNKPTKQASLTSFFKKS